MTYYSGKKIILASASPRRKRLLEGLGLTFEIIPADIDETVSPDIPPDIAVKDLSLRKARHVGKSINYPALILGSDTTVVIDNKSLGKPEDFDEAVRMLKLLGGRIHTVITGVAIIDNETNTEITDCVSSQVKFKDISEEEIIKYINTVEPMDKAGSYAIQGIGSIFIEEISGCYTNIVGLPVFRLSQMLQEIGLDILDINSKKK